MSPSAIQLSSFEPTMVVIFDSTLGADAASFDVQDIPQGYGHLLVHGQLRGTEAATQTQVTVRFNNDSGASQYDGQYRYVQGNNTVGVTANENATSMIVGIVASASGTANRAGAVRMLIPNYAGTTFHKDLKCETGYVRDTTVPASIITTNGVGIWKSTAAITRLTVLPVANNWKAGSRLTVYGTG